MIISKDVFNPAHWSSLKFMKIMTGLPIKGSSVLEIGCGSGILSITADKLGADKVTAVDISPVAVKCARDNAKASNSKIEIDVDYLNFNTDGKYDLILANLDPTPAGELMQYIDKNCKRGTMMIISWHENMPMEYLTEKFDIIKDYPCPNGFIIYLCGYRPQAG